MEWGGGAKEGAKPNIPAAVCIIHCNYPLIPDNHDPCRSSSLPLRRHRHTFNMSSIASPPRPDEYPICWSDFLETECSYLSSWNFTLEPRLKSSRNKVTPRVRNSSIASDSVTDRTTNEVIFTLGQSSETSIWPTVSTMPLSPAPVFRALELEVDKLRQEKRAADLFQPFDLELCHLLGPDR